MARLVLFVINIKTEAENTVIIENRISLLGFKNRTEKLTRKSVFIQVL